MLVSVRGARLSLVRNSLHVNRDQPFRDAGRSHVSPRFDGRADIGEQGDGMLDVYFLEERERKAESARGHRLCVIVLHGGRCVYLCRDGDRRELRTHRG